MEPRRRIWLRRLAYELADRILFLSHHLRDFHTRQTGFAADKISVIHNGVDSRRFFPDPATRIRMRKELALAEDDFCIGCVENLFPVKDHISALKALERLNREGAKCRLLLVGEGPELPKLESFLIAHPKCRQHVSFLGTSDRVSELLNAIDVCVLPSLTEGISNSLLEAMASGVPVVVTATGGNPEVVVDGVSGLLFPVGDDRRLAEQISLLKSRSGLRSELVCQALGRVREKFSIDSMVRKYEQLYDGLSDKLSSRSISRRWQR